MFYWSSDVCSVLWTIVRLFSLGIPGLFYWIHLAAILALYCITAYVLFHSIASLAYSGSSICMSIPYYNQNPSRDRESVGSAITFWLFFSRY